VDDIVVVRVGSLRLSKFSNESSQNKSTNFQPPGIENMISDILCTILDIGEPVGIKRLLISEAERLGPSILSVQQFSRRMKQREQGRRHASLMSRKCFSPCFGRPKFQRSGMEPISNIFSDAKAYQPLDSR
jgi:hypothetical protein